MPSIEENIQNALSIKRIETYEHARGITKPGLNTPLPLAQALHLYAWNARISAAFMHPLHICEVVVRNGVSDALSRVYGDHWPWSAGFLQSLPNPTPRSHHYNMRVDLIKVRNQQTTTGKVIPELSFVFWQNMFTGRHDDRVWTPHLRTCFPNYPENMAVAVHRKWMYDTLDKIRRLRNRIAHHEPIFARELAGDYASICELIACRCRDTEQWTKEYEQVSSLLTQRPV